VEVQPRERERERVRVRVIGEESDRVSGWFARWQIRLEAAAAAAAAAEERRLSVIIGLARSGQSTGVVGGVRRLHLSGRADWSRLIVHAAGSAPRLAAAAIAVATAARLTQSEAAATSDRLNSLSSPPPRRRRRRRVHTSVILWRRTELCLLLARWLPCNLATSQQH